MATIMTPRDSGRFIAENSKGVKIISDGVRKIAEFMAQKIKEGSYNMQSWKEHELNPKTMDKAALDWIFVSDTLNFSFWSEDENDKYVVNYGGKKHTGYWSLCAAINRALDEGIPFTDPHFYATITRDKLEHVLRSDSKQTIPLLDERLQVLQEAGKVLLQKFDGSFVNVIRLCEKSAQTLVQMIVENFPSYRDMTEFCGKTVAIYKRAQILVADIWACFEGKGYGEFTDIDTITMFADYRIPQALLYFGVIEYSDELMEFLRKDPMMKTGDRYEVEIRGCSIWATELVSEETRRILDADVDGRNLISNSIIIDFYLWDYRRAHADEMGNIPFHKIRCIYY
ncbi:queuosine salvage protein-like [Dreissena polymorpha]|uniref:Queuosine 5'-phosphate N-glycosylase/hydrolase n=1 Tax=Dreissena polymorpha TaxID=45954 RepID=A0A9D4L2H3_DREPO|nr:queuosine salvage protein-like [Dreissena polymorpha]KAH3850687.1 hypothetical protein DPMN_093112 [Dreissena polymorpha]